MLPGLAGQIDESQIDTEGMKFEEAILRSMTKRERANYLIIGPKRRARIAKGSGTSVAEVNRLIKKFEKSRNMMRKMVKNKGAMAQMMGAGPAAGGMPRAR
jgi:signal recognition particle subunit SRP54